MTNLFFMLRISKQFSSCLSTAEAEKFKFSEDNPFVDADEEEENGPSPVASVGYRYRFWDLGDGVKLVARCEHDAVVQGNSEKDVQVIARLSKCL